MAVTDTIDVTDFGQMLEYAFALLPEESQLEGEVGSADFNTFLSQYDLGDEITKTDFMNELGLDDSEAEEMEKLYRLWNTLVGTQDIDLLEKQTDPAFYGGQMGNILRGKRLEVGNLMAQAGRQVGRGMETTPGMARTQENIETNYLNTIIGALIERGKGMSQAERVLADIINQFAQGAHGIVSRHEYQ